LWTPIRVVSGKHKTVWMAVEGKSLEAFNGFGVLAAG
jgi:hypothetical protein